MDASEPFTALVLAATATWFFANALGSVAWSVGAATRPPWWWSRLEQVPRQRRFRAFEATFLFLFAAVIEVVVMSSGVDALARGGTFAGVVYFSQIVIVAYLTATFVLAYR